MQNSVIPSEVEGSVLHDFGMTSRMAAYATRSVSVVKLLLKIRSLA